MSTICIIQNVYFTKAILQPTRDKAGQPNIKRIEIRKCLYYTLYITLNVHLFQERRSSGTSRYTDPGPVRAENSRPRPAALLRTPPNKGGFARSRSPETNMRGRRENFQISVRNEGSRIRSKFSESTLGGVQPNYCLFFFFFSSNRHRQ